MHILEYSSKQIMLLLVMGNIDYKVLKQGTGFAITCNNGFDNIANVKLINNSINFS